MAFSLTAGVLVAAAMTLLPVVAAQLGVSAGASGPAQVTAQWLLSRADKKPIGIITQLAACPDRVYLMGASIKTIYLVDLRRQTLAVAFSPDVLGPAIRNSGDLVGMFADCANGRLSVVVNPMGLAIVEQPSFVAEFDATSNRLIRTFDLPLEFSPIQTGAAYYDAATRRAYLPGIWPVKRNSWLAKPVSLALTDVSFGLVLSLDNGSATKFLPGIEPGCRAWVGHCMASSFVRSRPDEWVFAHALGTQLYLIRGGQNVKAIDMRSPMFKYAPADSVPRNAPRDAGVAWAYRNSEIRRLFAVDEQIVASHAHASMAKANAGGWVDFTAYLNVFSKQGDRVHSDLRVSGLPLGASPDGVWVISYRPERNNAAREILVQLVSPRPASKPRR